jgi:hypothetical protein
MDLTEFQGLLEELTGTSVKELTNDERSFLETALQDDTRRIGAPQFNELLLLANKDRVEPPFFSFFFETSNDGSSSACTIGRLRDGVDRFKRFALLSFGNFIFAFRQLSPLKTIEDLRERIGDPCRMPAEIDKALEQRSEKVLKVTSIPRDQSYLVGYLSTREITADRERARELSERVTASDSDGTDLERQLRADLKMAPAEREAMLRIVIKLRQLAFRAGSDSVPTAITKAKQRLDEKWAELNSVQETAQRNTTVYLTWDYMDVYFATSMRKRWEFEDLHRFVNALMNQSKLLDLPLRHFDPTQSYEKNRVDKGLVEALMLKRALVTVYSIQDTDTLGKDSELAATLAQGKPVIAFAPEVDLAARKDELENEHPLDLRDRFQFVLYADEASRADNGSPVVTDFLDACTEYEKSTPWRSITDQEAGDGFRASHAGLLSRFCEILASAEGRITDNRARTLRDSHPLGIQVNLETGVANGVLVVRSIPDCAELIYRIITNRMEFEIIDDDKLKAWVLRDRLTDCIYRVVTRTRKLTNCFWNFYRKPITQRVA